MTSTLQTVKALFLGALQFQTESQRAAFLDQTCGPDKRLRGQIERLLRAHGNSRRFLGGTERETLDLPLEGLGSEIGRYRLLEVLGVGGMGVVYRAEQTTPHKRHVALKIIKPGLDSQQIAARFELDWTGSP